MKYHHHIRGYIAPGIKNRDGHFVGLPMVSLGTNYG